MVDTGINDLVLQLGTLTGRLNSSLEHLATKADIARVEGKLDAHLQETDKTKLSQRRMWLVLFGAVTAVAVPQILATIF